MRRALITYGLISLVVSAVLVAGAVSMFQSLVSYRNPFPVRQDFAASGHGPALTQHVVLVVVDGLRVDTARTMQAFRPNQIPVPYRGGQLSVSLPTYSLPTWAVIGTGTTQAVTGVAMNLYRQPAISNIFAKAKAAGLSTAMVAGTGWDDLYGKWIDRKYVFPGELAEAEIARRAADMAATASLTLAYFPRADEVAHALGADSRQYAEAAAAIDKALLQLLDSVDLTTTTVIITADHGHVAAGGHGGPEPDVTTAPLVMYGQVIQPGPGIAGKQTDIAPTVAALLGIGYPDFVQGEPLVDAIASSSLERDAIVAAWAAQVEKGTVALLPALGAVVRPISGSTPRERAEACLARYDAAVAALAARDMWTPGRWAAFAATVAVAALIAVSLRRYTTRASVLGALTGVAVTAVAALVGPLRLTFSSLTGPAQVILALAGYAAAGLLATLSMMVVARNRGQSVPFRTWAFALVQVQIVVFGFAAGLHVLRGPALISGYMPDFAYWLLKVFLSGYAAVGNIVMLAGLLPVWLISRWAARHTVDSPTLIVPLPGRHEPS
ncbi:MAG: alkaline phosphatase family protein [Chloroflexota bacterium]